jgi:DNA-binding response OmpR family regulator
MKIKNRHDANSVLAKTALEKHFSFYSDHSSRVNNTVRDKPTTGSLEIDWSALKLTLNGKRLHLTSTEFKLLSLFLEMGGATQSRQFLLEKVWGYGDATPSRTLDAHVSRLRKKLGESHTNLQTIHGQGYRFVTLATNRF